MSVQAVGALIGTRYALYAAWINGLALFFALCGAWLLIATRVRQARAMARRVAGEQVLVGLEQATSRVNRFFNGFGAACLGLALAVSWCSTQL